MTFAQILAFVVIWVVVPLLFLLVASLLTKAMEAISLGWLNRWLGAGFVSDTFAKSLPNVLPSVPALGMYSILLYI